MEQGQYQVIAQTVEEAVDTGALNILDVYADKIKNLKLSIKTKKELAKELNVDEKTTMNWKIVSDLFSFVDIATLAKEHPNEISNTFKVIINALGSFLTVFKFIAPIANKLPKEKFAKLIEWLSIPTPEHLVHVVAEKQANKKPKN